ncbi:MAG: uroporphyrinogen decarboxylase [candidate division Zixibacteria bacterium RBG_16_53_22]|nr:MAG: uroporphyrinogen decarboxylase [candidate division Zixibacteria bacterium RBG_16_53_22]
MTKRELFLANLRGEYTDKTPIWIMRQAGRYLPEYREYKRNFTFEQLCRTPKAVAEVTAQPVEILDLDAAIIFSDILLILEPLGVNLKFDPGPTVAPILERPEQIEKYRDFDPANHLWFVAEALIETRKRIGPDLPLLGFCGAPFTLFCYLCGIKGAKDFHKAVKFAINYPEATARLLGSLTDVSLGYLRMQVKAGADSVQIFDTWAGELAAEEFSQWSLPYIRRITDELSKDGAYTSVYIKGAYHLLDQLSGLKANIISVDWRAPLSEAARRLAPKTIQGNLDPNLLLGPIDLVVRKAGAMLEEMAAYPGYIFNLGHGILPETPVANVRALVETVHAFERKKR